MTSKSEWQLIETFYKRSDTTEKVLVYIPGSGARLASLEFFGGHRWVVGDAHHKADDPMPAGNAPTHWQPLPAPPESDQ